MSYILTFDQGTSSSRAIVFDRRAVPVTISQQEFTQIYPEKSFVEQDPEEIFLSQYHVAKQALADARLKARDIAALGITNQRETTIVWDKATGLPVYNAIVWQDKRTMKQCRELQKKYTSLVKKKTGLVIDPYFSATKIQWILDHVEGVRARAVRGEVLFGTVDTWLIWRFSKGRLHITDVSNASRTMLFNINTLEWDKELLELFDIPAAMLPEVRSSSQVYGHTDPEFFGGSIPIAGLAGDQQAALFGQTAFGQGDVKATFGTGCFMLMNTGREPRFSDNGLLTTVAWQIKGETFYALEGNIFIAGAAIKWLRDKLRLIDTAEESETLALSVKSSKGVFVIPALAGLGAPYWNANVNGVITGLTLDSKKEHIVRAALESLAFRVKDLVKLIKKDSGLQITGLAVDGGASANNFLMQFVADVLNTEVKRPAVLETTALGAALLAGLATDFWTMEDIKKIHQAGKVFSPGPYSKKAKKQYKKWKKIVKIMLKY